MNIIQEISLVSEIQFTHPCEDIRYLINKLNTDKIKEINDCDMIQTCNLILPKSWQILN